MDNIRHKTQNVDIQKNTTQKTKKMSNIEYSINLDVNEQYEH